MQPRPLGDHMWFIPETGRRPGADLRIPDTPARGENRDSPSGHEGFGAGRALAIFLAYLACQLVVGAGIGFVYGFWSVASGAGFPEEIPGVWLLAGGALGVIAGGVMVLRMTRHTLNRSGADFASLGWRGAKRKEVVAAAVVGIALSISVLPGVTAIFPPPSEDAVSPLAEAASDSAAAQLVLTILALLLAPPIEEFLFRGVMLSGFTRSWGRLVAGVAVTGLFTLAHLAEMTGYLPALIVIAIVGAAALLVRLRSGSLAPAIVLHGAYNLTLVTIFLLSA